MNQENSVLQIPLPHFINQEIMKSVDYIERESKKVLKEEVPSGGLLKWLYNTPTGKASLNILVKRKLFSNITGWYMNRSCSRKKIKKFIKKYDINMSHYELPNSGKFSNFNKFFYRRIKETVRPIGIHIVSPADGKAVAFQNINSSSSFYIKGSEFSLSDFLQNNTLAHKYCNGAMIIVRLAPTDYHRFHFPASGIISESKKIKGRYFSVSPLALKKNMEIFCRNQREYSILKTEDYGDIIISEIGATMVGSIIQNYQINSIVKKGSEKGYFAFGGSTLLLLFEEGKIKIDQDLLEHTINGYETKVRMGETIARKIS